MGSGRYPIKRVVGDALDVRAAVLKGGYESLAVELQVRRPGDKRWHAAPMTYFFDDDEWIGEVTLGEIGAWTYRVAAWTDHYQTWRTEVLRKQAAGRELSSELLEGATLLREFATHAKKPAARVLLHAADQMTTLEQDDAIAAATSAEVAEAAFRADPREDVVTSDSLEAWVDRERALFGAWYELFPRSQSPVMGQHGTLRDVEQQLSRLHQLGFDIVYLPPIHPIGATNRKGKNNSLIAEPGDTGSPWAIGSADGGHDAIHPELGTIDDFDHLVAAAADLGMEIALDLALQCSPDHPYVRDHPEWFRRRPDGTIKYAENPPKRYEDIVALDLWCDDYPALWAEIRRVVLHWVEHGVRVFRVDNPHTKPLAFWSWLIREVRALYPDVFFLAEAFTRPRMMHELAKIGFSQSYTYFTWRNARWEIESYGEEVSQGPGAEYMRPNFFANTPDILHEYLQTGGRPAFKVRLALAATLSPSYGIYSGYELCENVPVRPGSEEYLDSEKYQLRQRAWDQPGNLSDYIATVNRARRENPALHELTNLRFHDPGNPQMVAYSKATAAGDNRVLIVANLDPFIPQECTVVLDGSVLGLSDNSTYRVHDLITGQSWQWRGLQNYVRLDPADEPVHLFRIEAE